MTQITENQKQLYQRLIELSDLAIQRKRELESIGDTRRRSGRKNDDYLTEEERQEFLKIGRKLAEVKINEGYVYCQGKSWKLPQKISN